MLKIKVTAACDRTLSWLAAQCEGYEPRCSWMLEKEGFLAWQSYERAWGNPVPDYATDWAFGGPVVARLLDEGMLLQKADYSLGFKATLDKFETCYFASTPLRAALCALVARKFGPDVDVPDLTFHAANEPASAVACP